MIFRWLLGLPLAAIVTAGLFVFMSGMISQDLRLDADKSVPDISIIAKIKPRPPVTGTTPKPDPITPPKEIKIKFPDGTDNPQPVNVGPLPGPGAIGAQGIDGLGGSVGPTIRVAPAFPESCRSREIQGVVIVEFDVTAEGAVTNIRILSSPHSCFERTVKRAVSRWKYSPRKVNGRAVPRRGVKEAINFQLS